MWFNVGFFYHLILVVKTAYTHFNYRLGKILNYVSLKKRFINT